MPWNGLGTYVLPPAYSPEVNGTTIDATRYNGLTDDVAVGISNSLNKNGENSPTAAINWGAQKITNLAPGTAAGDAIAYNQAPPSFIQSVNGGATLVTTNSNAGVAAYAGYIASNGVDAVQLLMTGANYTTLAMAGVQSGLLYSNGPGGIAFIGTSGSLRFAANGTTEQMRLHTNGFLGLGTSGPDSLLTLAGVGQIAHFNAGNADSGVYFKFNNLGGNSYIGQDNSTGASLAGVGYALAFVTESAHPIVFSTGNTRKMQLAAAGQLLLGTDTLGVGASSSTALSIANGTATVYQSIKASGGEEFFAGAGAGSTVLGSFSNTPLFIFSNNTIRMSFAGASGDITAQGVALTRVKAAATTINNTATFASDPDLAVALPVGKWAIDMLLLWTVGNSGGADGRKAQLTFSGTVTSNVGFWLDNDNTLASSQSSTNSGFFAGLVVAAQTTGTWGWTVVKGTVVVTVAGTLTLQWAQNAAGAHNLSVGIGSYLKATKVA